MFSYLHIQLNCLKHLWISETILRMFCFTSTPAKADCLLGKTYHSKKLYYFKIPFLSLQIFNEVDTLGKSTKIQFLNIHCLSCEDNYSVQKVASASSVTGLRWVMCKRTNRKIKIPYWFQEIRNLKYNSLFSFM